MHGGDRPCTVTITVGFDFGLAHSASSFASKRNSLRRPVPRRQTKPIFRAGSQQRPGDDAGAEQQSGVDCERGQQCGSESVVDHLHQVARLVASKPSVTRPVGEMAGRQLLVRQRTMLSNAIRG